MSGRQLNRRPNMQRSFQALVTGERHEFGEFRLKHDIFGQFFRLFVIPSGETFRSNHLLHFVDLFWKSVRIISGVTLRPSDKMPLG